MQIRRITTYEAIYYILDEIMFPHLLSCIESEGEVRKKRNGEYDVRLVNGRDFSENKYTNPYDSECEWIAGFSDDNPDECAMLQLISVDSDGVELVNCEKRTGEKNVFCQIVRWVEKEYPGKRISTFPMTDKLEEYYTGFGFRKEGDILVN